MKIPIIATVLIFMWMPPLHSQNETEELKGKVSGKIFTNFNYGIGDKQHPTAFELQRAYFGYERQLSEHFFANVKLDVGSPDDISAYSKLRRYAYFKNAGLTYKNNNITIWGGLFDMRQFKMQEKFWGYRYLYKSYMDEYKIGPSADLGAGLEYKFSDKISSDLIVSNGEGYSSPQRDDTYKTGLGLTFKPLDALIIRTYYSIFTAEHAQMTFSGFVAYKAPRFRIAGEVNFQKNYKFNPNYNRYGYSLYSTYKYSDAWEIFVRYDQLYSNIVKYTTIPWNLANDGSALIGGIQFTPISNIHLTVDYQDWVEYAGNGDKDQTLFVHLEVNF